MVSLPAMFVDDRVLMEVNQVRREARGTGAEAPVERLLEILFGASCRFAAYGTLQPGRQNHHWLDGVHGTWQPGFVHGHVRVIDGYPVLRLDPDGDRVPVGLLTSEQLPAHWPKLDELEGANYRRSLVAVHGEAGPLAVATIYDGAPRVATR